MNTKPFTTRVSRHIRTLMWVNALLFTLPVHAVLLRRVARVERFSTQLAHAEAV